MVHSDTFYSKCLQFAFRNPLNRGQHVLVIKDPPINLLALNRVVYLKINNKNNSLIPLEKKIVYVGDCLQPVTTPNPFTIKRHGQRPFRNLGLSMFSKGSQQFLYLKSEYTYASNLDSMIQEPKMHIIYVPRINVCFHIRHFLNGLDFVSKKRPMNSKA